MAFIPAFSEPQSYWPRVPPRPALGQSGGEARAAGGTTPPVPLHPGRIGPHLRFRHPSIHLQLQHPGQENRILPSRHRRPRCGNPNSHGPIADWMGRVERRQHGGIGPHPRFRYPSVPLPGSAILPYLYNTAGTKIDFSRVDTAPHGVETLIPRADR